MRGEVPDPMNLLGERQHFIYPTVEAYAHAVEAARPSLNVGTLIGHTALRNNHMDDLFRPASETEIAGMRIQLRDALRQGALGLSTGLAYASAFQSTTEEVMALAEELTAEGNLHHPPAFGVRADSGGARRGVPHWSPR
jgi:N-acyl-D-amino-acid deacylase